MGTLISFRGSGRLPRCGDFAPAGDPLSLCRQRKEAKKTTPVSSPLEYEGCPAMLAPCDLAELAALRSAQTGGESQMWKRASARRKTLCFSAKPQGSEAALSRRARFALANSNHRHALRRLAATPLLRRREAQDPEARAQHASTSDSHRLSEQSVATRVRGGLGIRASQGTPCTQGAAQQGRLLCLLSWAPKKVGRPPGRNAGTVCANEHLSANCAAPRSLTPRSP